MRTLSTTELKSGFDWAVSLARAPLLDGRQAVDEAVRAVDGAPREGSPFGNGPPSMERHRARGG